MDTAENVVVGDNVVVERRSDVDTEQPPGEAHSVAQADLPADHAPPIRPLPEFTHLLLLATFAQLPRSLVRAVRPLPLARNGFFYIGNRFVRCYYCGADVPLLRGHESSTLQRHGTLSPGCLLYGPGHPESETAARSVLFWALRSVEVRRQGINRQDDLNRPLDWR